MRCGRLGVPALMGLLACGSPAIAQEARRLNVQAEAHTAYDTNVARSNDAIAATRGITPEDVIFSPRLSIDLLYPVSRQSLFLKGGVGHNFYRRNSILDSGAVDLQGGMNARLGLCQGVLSGNYVRQQADLQDLNLAATRNIQDLKTVGLQASCGASAGFAPTFQVSHVWMHNSARLLKPSDYQAFSGMVGLAYRQPAFGELMAFGRYDRTSFPARLIPLGPDLAEDGYDVRGAGVSYKRRLGARIEGEVSTSYTSVKPDIDLYPSFRGMTYKATASFRANSRGRVGVSFERDAKPSNRPGFNYSVDRILQVDANYDVGARLKLSAGLFRGGSRYMGSALIGNTDLTRDRVKAAYGAIRWESGRRLALVIDGRREVRTANLAAFNYSATRIGLSASAAF